MNNNRRGRNRRQHVTVVNSRKRPVAGKTKDPNMPKIDLTNIPIDEYEKYVTPTNNDNRDSVQEIYTDEGIPVVDMSHEQLSYELKKELLSDNEDNYSMTSNQEDDLLQDKQDIHQMTRKVKKSDIKNINTNYNSESSNDMDYTDDTQSRNKIVVEPGINVTQAMDQSQSNKNSDPIEEQVDNENNLATNKGKDENQEQVDNENNLATNKGKDENARPAKKIKWTPNEVTDSLKANDTTTFVGYISQVIGQSTATNNVQVMHVVLRSLDREIQLTAWRDNVDKLKEVAEKGNIIRAKRVSVHPDKAKTGFNKADNDRSLRVQYYSTLSVIGYYEEDEQSFQNITDTDLNTVLQKNGKIRLTAYVKNTFRWNNLSKIMCGSVTDGTKVIEINLLGKEKRGTEIEKGQQVTIIGVVRKRTKSNVHYIEVAAQDTLEINETSKMTDLEIFGSFQHI